MSAVYLVSKNTCYLTRVRNFRADGLQQQGPHSVGPRNSTCLTQHSLLLLKQIHRCFTFWNDFPLTAVAKSDYLSSCQHEMSGYSTPLSLVCTWNISFPFLCFLFCANCSDCFAWKPLEISSFCNTRLYKAQQFLKCSTRPSVLICRCTMPCVKVFSYNLGITVRTPFL